MKAERIIESNGLIFELKASRAICAEEAYMDGDRSTTGKRNVLAYDSLTVSKAGKVIDSAALQHFGSHPIMRDGKKLIARIGGIYISEESGLYPLLRGAMDDLIATIYSPEMAAIDAENKASEEAEIAEDVARIKAAQALEDRLTMGGRTW